MNSSSLLNGEAIDGLSLNNRAALYGDGVFRTVLVWNGQVHAEQAQLQKLSTDARAIGLSDYAEQQLLAALRKQAQQTPQAVVRISLIAKDTPRGYARDGKGCDWLLQSTPLPAMTKNHASQGIGLAAVPWQLSSQPQLAGIKHLNRLDQVMARRLLPADCQEGVVHDAQGHWVSGIMSNLFWYQRGQWHTRAIQDCGVAGVMRDLIMQYLDSIAQPVRLVESCGDADLREAKCVFVCNSLMGIWPVRFWRDLQGQETQWATDELLKFPPLIQLQQCLQHPLCP